MTILSFSTHQTTKVACSIALLLFGLSCFTAVAQNRANSGAGQVRKVAFPSPYVRMLAIQAYLEQEGIEVKWSEEYNRTALTDLDVNSLADDEVTLCTAIGIRLSDGVIALLGKDEKKMRRCAQDIQSCARKLEAGLDDMPAIGQLSRSIEAGDWSHTLFELGMIQQEIVAKLDADVDSTATVVVASGAWLQGIIYASNLILDHQKEVDLSNMLRAPQIASFLGEKLQGLPEDVKEIPQFRTSLKVLKSVEAIIDIDRDETIEPEKLVALRNVASEALAPIKDK